MFANLVVELKKHHYSQRGLAAYIGISESSMNDKMNGRTQFTLREAKAIQAVPSDNEAAVWSGSAIPPLQLL